jgi:hypothetical protein
VERTIRNWNHIVSWLATHYYCINMKYCNFKAGLRWLFKDITLSESLVITRHILVFSAVVINDYIYNSNEIAQTNGVLQGYPLRPLLFSIVTANSKGNTGLG